LAKERNICDEEDFGQRSRNGVPALQTETLRSTSNAGKAHEDEHRGDRLNVFWRVFGGTILSIAALVFLTAYNNLSSTLSDLRKDINQQYESRGELVKKDDFNKRMTSVWEGVKDLRASNAASVGLSERAKILDQQQDRQMKAGDEDRKELQRKLEEWRKSGDEERKELRQKLEDQRKALEDERREFARKFEEQRKQLDDDRKELSRSLQMLAERLATVEGRQTAKPVGPLPAKD
jgi:hypothetical protein